MSLVSRLIVVAVAAATLTFVIPRFTAEMRAAPLASLSERVTAGLRFDAKPLGNAEAALAQAEGEPGCNLLRRPAVIVRSYELIIARMDDLEQDAATRLAQSLQDARARLACAPSDAFGWLILYTSEALRSGRPRSYLPMLEMSYLLAPNEGWIASSRNEVAWPFINAMNPTLKQSVQDEFVHMARDAPMDAAGIIASAEDSLRPALYGLLAGAPQDKRDQIVWALERRNIVVPPGIGSSVGTLRR